MPETRLQSDMIQNMGRSAATAMFQRNQILANQQEWLDYVQARDMGAFQPSYGGGYLHEEYLPGERAEYAKAQREYQDDQRQAWLNHQKFLHGQMAKQQELQNRQAYYDYVKQQEERQNQTEATNIAKTISELQDPNSQAYKELSPVERVNTINRLRAKLHGIGAGPSRVHIEEVDNGLKYPDWHDKAGQPLPPDRVITYEDGKIERVNAWDDMLKGEKARAEALTAINKAQQKDDLPPRFDPDAEGFDRGLRDKHIEARRGEIEDDAKEHGERRKREKQDELSAKQQELDGDYEGAKEEYEIELEEWKEQKDAHKEWKKKFPDASKAYTEATRDEYLEENPNANFVERNGKFFLYSDEPEVGDRPRAPRQSEYKIYDSDSQSQRAYDKEYRRRRTELEATLEEDAKERMRVHECSASLGMPGMENIASMGPSMAVNPDTGHQINFEGESWA